MLRLLGSSSVTAHPGGGRGQVPGLCGQKAAGQECPVYILAERRLLTTDNLFEGCCGKNLGIRDSARVERSGNDDLIFCNSPQTAVFSHLPLDTAAPLNYTSAGFLNHRSGSGLTGPA